MPPHRFTPASVDRFLPILNLVLTQGDVPLRITVRPSDIKLSCETVTARLRDAAKAISSGHVHTTITDLDRFTRLWNQYYVTSDGEYVYVVPKAEKDTRSTHLLKGAVSPTTGSNVSPVLATLNAKDSTPSVLHAFALLLGLRLLKGQVEILSDVPQELQNELMTKHDVAMVSEKGKVLMI